jgi:hypothetical protein
LAGPRRRAADLTARPAAPELGAHARQLANRSVRELTNPPRRTATRLARYVQTRELNDFQTIVSVSFALTDLCENAHAAD